MLTIEDVAAYALRLPETTESTKWKAWRAWTVAGKDFAWERPFTKADLRRFGDAPVPPEPIVAVKTEDLGDKAAILETGDAGFFSIQHLENYPAYLISLPQADDRRVRDALLDGWLACAPPALAVRFLAERGE